MLIEKKFKNSVTVLNKHDRKVLDKYTKFYSNFIESSTAKSDILLSESYKTKE